MDRVVGLGWLTLQACCLSIQDLEPSPLKSFTYYRNLDFIVQLLYIHIWTLRVLFVLVHLVHFVSSLATMGITNYLLGLKIFSSNKVQ